MPVRKIGKDGKLELSESVVQSKIITYLSRIGVDFNRVNGAKMKFSESKNGRTKSRFVSCNSINGKADIETWCHIENENGDIFPVSIYIEVKRSHGGSQSDDQKKFQSLIEKHGGYYVVVHSLDELLKYIDDVKSDISKKFPKWDFYFGRSKTRSNSWRL